MTELLIFNNSTKELIFYRHNINQNIINYILQPHIENSNSIEMLYNIDFSLQRCSIIGSPISETHPNLLEEYSSIFLDTERILGQNPQNFFTLNGNQIIIFFHYHSKNQIQILIDSITKKLKEKYQINFIFGIGCSSYTLPELQESFEQARSALHWNQIFNQSNFLFYDDLGFGTVLSSISTKRQKYYLDNIFKNKTDSQINQIIELLEVYETYNGSISKCAEHLFIHKNTVQYQLNKIAQDTGLSPRNLGDFFSLKLACMLYQLGTSSKNN